MELVIEKFPEQFLFKPKIQNFYKRKKTSKYLLCGMGGSHLAGDLLKIIDPTLNIVFHQDYGLPPMKKDSLKERLIILNSYSGNTEEVISSFFESKKIGLLSISVSTGGKLLHLAKKYHLPYIQIPNTNIQPRMALGFSLKALLRILNKKREEKEAERLYSLLKPKQFKEQGRDLALALRNFVPVIYASLKNFPIAYIWKIKFNETAKIPAFCNHFPELNHNEMTGFDRKGNTPILSRNFYFLILQDREDKPQIRKRIKVLSALYQERGLKTKFISLFNGKGIFYKIFSSLLLADWVSLFLAKEYNVEPEQVPMVEEFKRLIRKN